MVNWLVGTTDRFKAAVSENGVTNQVSDWANSDSGPEYDRASLLGDPFSAAGIDKLWRGSPLRHETSIRTPLLMLQAESDLRCPPQDNEQLFHRPASPSGGRWSTSSIPTSGTPMRPAVDRTGGSTG